jgi:hypothetical protein
MRQVSELLLLVGGPAHNMTIPKWRQRDQRRVWATPRIDPTDQPAPPVVHAGVMLWNDHDGLHVSDQYGAGCYPWPPDKEFNIGLWNWKPA